MHHSKIILVLILLSALSLSSCGNASKSTSLNAVESSDSSKDIIKETLTPDDYEKRLIAKKDYILVDVRTPAEYGEKHLANAVNVDYNSADFEKNIQSLDNSKPVFIYCKSGGRSSSAVEVFEKAGFKEIYNLEGGLMRWTAENKSFEDEGAFAITGISMEDYKRMTSSSPVVMIDFNAVWCGPCKKLKPVLESMEKEGMFKLISIDVDENNVVSEHFKITSIPLIKLYKNGKEVWTKLGYDDKMKDAEIAEITEAVKNKK